MSFGYFLSQYHSAVLRSVGLALRETRKKSPEESFLISTSLSLFKLMFIGVWLLYSVVLISTVQQMSRQPYI